MNDRTETLTKTLRPRKPTFYAARTYTKGERALVNSLFREFMDLQICVLLSYDAPYDEPVQSRPIWFDGGISYNTDVNQQTAQQREWICENAADLPNVRLRVPSGTLWAEFFLDDRDSVCIVVREDTIPIVTELPAFKALDLGNQWEISKRLTVWDSIRRRLSSLRKQKNR